MKILFVTALALLLSACSAKNESGQGIGMSGRYTAASAPVADAVMEQEAKPLPTRRYIALRHSLKVEAPEADLHKHFDAIQAACIKLGCIVLDADQSLSRPNQNASATLTARIPPQAFDAFLKTMLEHGKLLQHKRDSEDLTAQVIDVDAKIANLTALKTRILDLLAKKTGNMEEVLAAEAQLSKTQADLDSILGQRKALASQTDMTRVELHLVTESLHAEESWLAPVAEAATTSGHVLMSSLGVMITVVVALLPWLLIVIPLFLWLRKLYRARKARRAQAAI